MNYLEKWMKYKRYDCHGYRKVQLKYNS